MEQYDLEVSLEEEQKYIEFLQAKIRLDASIEKGRKLIEEQAELLENTDDK